MIKRLRQCPLKGLRIGRRARLVPDKFVGHKEHFIECGWLSTQGGMAADGIQDESISDPKDLLRHQA